MTVDIVRVYAVSVRLVGKLAAATGAVFEGIWLGLLSPEALARIDEIYYGGSRDYVDDTYNRQGLWGWEEQALDRHFGQASRLVVTSAGGGREVLALLDRGLDATGYEPHPVLAEFGSKLTVSAGHGPRVLRSGRDEWPSSAPDADGVIIGWGAYMLMPGRRRRIAFLRAAAATLSAGTPVLLSFFPRGRQQHRWRISKSVANVLRRLRGAERAELGDALVPNYVHYFTRAEVESELSEAGLDMVDFGADDYGWAVARVHGETEEDGATT